MNFTVAEIAGMIDHSLLQPAMNDAEVEAGCALAARWKVASVCVKPANIVQAVELLKGSGVKVGTVVGFPHGGATSRAKGFETLDASHAGAVEIDMVCNIGKVLSGDWTYVENDIATVCKAAHTSGHIVKVIFENDLLPNDETKIRLCKVSESAGADFVKTSTGYAYIARKEGGFATGGATEHDIKLMRENCSPRVQVKAAGGVRDLDTLLRLRDLGATRFGASATDAMLKEAERRIRGDGKPVTANATGGY